MKFVDNTGMYGKLNLKRFKNMKVTLKDIARECGVSLGTASLAINNRPGINEETRRRVISVAEKNGYQPSMNARTLTTKESNLIGLLVPNLTNLVYATLVQGIEMAFREIGYRMIIATTGNNEEYEKSMIEQFVSFRVAGVILYPSITKIRNPGYLDILKKNGIPLVFLAGYYRDIDAPHCMSDIYMGLKELTSHMYGQGYRKFRYIGGCRDIVSNQMKIKGISESLAHYGISFSDSDYIELSQSNFKQAYEAARNMIATGQDFDAVITADAYTGFGVYNALVEAGYSVPGDVGLAHMDNVIEKRMCVIHMTCLEQDLRRMIDCSVGMIMKMINGEAVSDVEMATRLVIRESTSRGI